jgi:Arylsulfotransferase (ASST)
LLSTDWSRREVLRGAGLATAGLGLVGLGAAGWLRKPASAPASGTPPAADTLQQFVSRPDLSPPVVTVTQSPWRADARLIFVASVSSGPSQGGAMILDPAGGLVWFAPDSPGQSKMNFDRQSYRGQPVLTWWQGAITSAGYGKGVAVVADSSYRSTHMISAVGPDKADLHEFVLTDQGTALLTVYRPARADLSALGGPTQGWVLSGVVQEIDVATGTLVFEWDSLDHVDVTETYLKFSGGTLDSPFDYFHINSIAVAPDGDLLISARHTWTVYKVARPSGSLAWRLNGKRSSFRMGPGARFFWQHHARPHGGSLLSIFDDGASPAEEKQSRAILVDIDPRRGRATLRRQYVHPGQTLLAAAMGSVQLLPDGRVFVGWGMEPYFSEFAPDGGLLLDGQLPAGDESYRAFTSNWAGRPLERPAVAARSGADGKSVVYASWNGSTQVESWAVLAGKTASSLAVVGSGLRAGFESVITVPSAGPYFAAEPRDASGRALARSAPVRLDAT